MAPRILQACFEYRIIFTAVIILLTGCATKTADLSKNPPRTMSEPVLVFYNDGAKNFQQQNFEAASEKYQAALKQAKALGDVAGIGFSLSGIGAVQQTQKEHVKALETFTEALPYFKLSQNLPTQALVLAAIGEIYTQMGEDLPAIRAFEQALAIADTLLKEASESEKLLIFSHREKVLVSKAQAHERLRDYSEAIKAYRGAAKDAKNTQNQILAGAALWHAGLASQRIGELEDAIVDLTEAASLLERHGQLKEASLVKLDLGKVQFQLGKREQAIAIFKKIGATSVANKFTEIAAQAYFYLGERFERLSDFQNALENYRLALSYLRLGHWDNKAKIEADILFNMGELHRWLSHYEEAIERLTSAILKYEELNHTKQAADALTQLAEIFFWIAEPKIAAGYYKQALEGYRKIGDQPKQIEVLAALGEIGYLTDEMSTEDGENYFNAGQRIVAALTGFDPLARVRDAKGRPLSQDDLHKIFYDWRETLPSLKSEYRMAAGVLYQKWGRSLLEGRDPVGAYIMLQPAFEYHSIPPSRAAPVPGRIIAIELAKDAYFLGEAYRQGGNYTAALNHFRFVEQIASNLRSPEIHFAYSGLARTYADLGDLENAATYYKRGLEILESVQGQQGTEDIKMGVFAGALYSYRDFLRLLLDTYRENPDAQYVRDSFEYNERLKARVFLDILGRLHTNQVNAPIQSSHEEIRRNIAQIHHRFQSRDLLQSEQKKLLDQLELLRNRWRNHQKESAQQHSKRSDVLSSKPTTVAAVQAVLDADTAFLAYTIAHEGSILWTVTKAEIQVFRLAGTELLVTLEKYLNTLRQPLIGTRDVTAHLELGQQLYRHLLGPAEDVIRQKKHLIISPDSLLHYLPFEALIIPPTSSQASRTVTLTDAGYLIKRYAVTYIPSASVLVAQRTMQRNTMPKGIFPLLAFGDPFYNQGNKFESPSNRTSKITNLALRDQNLKRLEFSGEEVRRIARVWGLTPDSGHIHLRERASVETLRTLNLSQYRIIHFAAHAILGDQFKTLSQPAIVLSQYERTNIEEGLLQLSDILELRLNADLVVLSACETGLGRLRDGEGVVGLTRAFLHAGATAAAVSLWKVEDQSTSLIMERFYQNLKRGLPKNEALRQAKLELMRTTVKLRSTGMQHNLAAPFFWAPFILVGNWDPIQ